MDKAGVSRSGADGSTTGSLAPAALTGPVAGGTDAAVAMLRRARRMARRLHLELGRSLAGGEEAADGRPALQGHDLFEAVYEDAPVAIALVDHGYRIVGANAALAELLQRPARELVGRQLSELSGSPQPARLILMAQKALSQDRPVSVEHRFVRGDGSEGWARTSLRRLQGAAGRHVALVGVVTDVTSDQQALEQHRREAELDPLTGLLNRRGGDRRLRSALARMAEQGPVAVIMADADGFKAINDQYGHAVGDEVLVGISGRLRSAIRYGDDVARLGGDEFIVVAWVAGEDEAMTIAQRCVQTVAEPIRSARTGGPHRVTLSAGLAVAYPGGPLRVETIIEAADAALYRAKSAGGNRCVMAPPLGAGAPPARGDPTAGLTGPGDG